MQKEVAMAKKAAALDSRQAALDALASSLGDPAPKLLTGKGTEGFFKGTAAAVKPLVELSLSEGWLEDTGEKTAGKNPKSLYRVTPKGRQAILDNNPTRKLLETLDQSTKSQLGQLQGVSAVLKSLSGAIQDVLEKVKNAPPPTLAVGPQFNGNGSTNGHAPADEVQRQIITRIRNHSIHNPITLPELFKELNARWPELSLGEFHDCVRRLWKQGQIKLGPYTRSYGVIASDYEAMFLDGQVMYYAFAA
jgi:DNA-binding PadR family transcriptional regulator